MIYSYRQNNSGGYYCKPAKHILVKNARDEEHATENRNGCRYVFSTVLLMVAIALAVVIGGYNIADEYDSLEDALLDLTRDDILRDSMESDNVPHYIVVDDLDVLDTVLE